MSTVLAISDTQFPFHHPDTFAFLKAVKEKYKPDTVVHIGDLFDFYALSDYPTDPDADSVGKEFADAMKATRKLYKLFPKAVLLTSNHDSRFFKRLKKAGIPSQFWPSYAELFDFPKGWSIADRFSIDKVHYIHGHQVNAGGGNVMQNAMKKYMHSVVFGHFHTRFGISYHANEDVLLFGMCIGALIDLKKYAFEYQRLQVRKPIIGTGLVIDGVPLLIPMRLTKSGRWDKKVG